MSADHHDTETLRLFVDEALCADEALEIAKHLAFCEECGVRVASLETVHRREIERQGESEGPAGFPDGFDHAFLQAFEAAMSERCKVETERAVAPELCRDLLRLTPARQRLVVRNSSRFHNWGLAELLLQRCRGSWREEPVHAEHLGVLGLEIAKRLEVGASRERLRFDLCAELAGAVANCRRICGRHLEASQMFTEAHAFLGRGTEDPLEEARLLDLRASLLCDQRDFAGAGRLLDRVVQIYGSVGETHLVGRALASRGKLHKEMGEPERASEFLEQAAELVDGEREPYLLFMLQHNRAHYLLDCGQPERAADLLPAVRDLVRRYGRRLDRLRVLWMEGLIRSALDQPELAAEALRSARDGFVAESIPGDAALVSLDLAAHYLKTGRLAEVRQLVGEMLPIFASRNLHRDALAALAVFRQAVEGEVATVKLVRQLSGWIRKAG